MLSTWKCANYSRHFEWEMLIYLNIFQQTWLEFPLWLAPGLFKQDKNSSKSLRIFCVRTWQVPRYSWSWSRDRWRCWCWRNWRGWASHSSSPRVCPAWDWTGTDPCSSVDHSRDPPSTWIFYWTPANKLYFVKKTFHSISGVAYPKIWNEADENNQEYQYDHQHYKCHHS